MIEWILTRWQMLLLGVATAFILATGIYLVGYMKGKASVENKVLTETVEKIVTQKQLEYVIMTKPKVEVQNELEKKWCRDCS